MNESATVNELIESRAETKDSMDALNRELKELRQTQDQLDGLLLRKMDAEGLSRTANAKASVSINEDTVPEVTNWDDLYQHVTETQDFSLLQRRVVALHTRSCSNSETQSLGYSRELYAA